MNRLEVSNANMDAVALLDVLPVLVWSAGRDARCDYFNQAWLEFTGRRLDEELGDGWVEGVHPDDREQCVKRYLEAFEARRSFVLEYRLRHRDGEYRWVRDLGRPRFTASGEFCGYIGGCLDVTSREEAEQALQQAIGERESLFRDMHDGLVQKIYAVGMVLEEADLSIKDAPRAARERIAGAIAGLNDVIGEVRGYISGASPEDTAASRLRAELGELVRTIGGSRRPQFHFRINSRAASRLSRAASRHVLNIVREALSNSLRHSCGDRGLISLQQHGNFVRVLITDDGCGFDEAQDHPGGRGLHNIATRAKELSARLDIRAVRGSGTRIVVDIPAEERRGAA